MVETRNLAAILAADVVGYSRLAGADQDRTLARMRTLRSDVIDPTIAVHNGRVVKRTGDGAIVEFRSAVDATRCAIEIQDAMVERTAGVPEDRRIVFRIGIHVGDVVEEGDGDLMDDGVNIAARLVRQVQSQARAKHWQFVENHKVLEQLDYEHASSEAKARAQAQRTVDADVDVSF